MNSYSISRIITLPFDETVSRTRAALKTAGFGIVTEINMTKVVQEKLGETMRPYLILGACNPALAYHAVMTEPDIGTLLPCNVCVWDNEDGTSTVSAINVATLFQLVSHPALQEVAREVDDKLRQAIDSLESETP